MRHLQRRTARQWQRATAEHEAGIAMIVVMTVMVILVLLTMVVFNQAVAQLPLARHDQDHESALHAAESGVEDYINHLNANNNYFSLGNTDAANGAFTGWLSLPGSGTVATNELYRYSVDTSAAATTGVVYLTASGCAAGSAVACAAPGAVIRTVKLGLRKVGFLDFVYFTDYEIFDPLISGLPKASCNFHEWEANPSTGGYGPDTSGTCLMGGGTPQYIRFITGDSLNGPVHSNDAFHICGTPTFGSLDSGYDLPLQAGYNYAGPNKYFDVCPTSPARVITGHNEAFPATNLLLSNEADTTVVGTASVGCQYYGQTTIKLYMSGGLPVMDVTNPYFLPTTASSPVALHPTGPTGFNCGTTAAHTALPLPPTPTAPGFNGVIYVKTVPSAYATAPYCSPSANCLGDVSVSGVLGGEMTIGADNNVNVTGNILYNGPGACNAAAACQLTGTDVLGLVAGNDVKIQHPNNCSPNNNPGCLPGLTIDAAMLSVQHSIYVDNWGSGDAMGLLNVYGTLAQRYRGVVGTGAAPGNTGYLKNYNWDSRLRYLSPPYFLSPAQSSWEHISFAELKPNPTP